MHGTLSLVVPCSYAQAEHNLEPERNSSLSLSGKIDRNVKIGEGATSSRSQENVYLLPLLE